MAKNFNVLRAKLSPEAQAATSTKLTRYEFASEVIGSLIAILTVQIAKEEGQPEPDAGKIAELTAQRSALAQERRLLDPNDSEQIEHVYRDYAPLVDAWVHR